MGFNPFLAILTVKPRFLPQGCCKNSFIILHGFVFKKVKLFFGKNIIILKLIIIRQKTRFYGIFKK